MIEPREDKVITASKHSTMVLGKTPDQEQINYLSKYFGTVYGADTMDYVAIVMGFMGLEAEGSSIDLHITSNGGFYISPVCASFDFKGNELTASSAGMALTSIVLGQIISRTQSKDAYYYMELLLDFINSSDASDSAHQAVYDILCIKSFAPIKVL